jgi:sugar phosphate isomerase/epimerase
VESEYQIMRSRIRSTHIHDNNGVADEHLYPYLRDGGTIDWNRTMRMLRARSEQYPLLLELKEDIEAGNPLEAAERIFEKLEAEQEPDAV